MLLLGSSLVQSHYASCSHNLQPKNQTSQPHTHLAPHEHGREKNPFITVVRPLAVASNTQSKCMAVYLAYGNAGFRPVNPLGRGRSCHPSPFILAGHSHSKPNSAGFPYFLFPLLELWARPSSIITWSDDDNRSLSMGQLV
jgi:hypothetical protein